MLIVKVGTNKKVNDEANDFVNNYFTLKEKVTLSGENVVGADQYFGKNIFGDNMIVYLENWNKEEYRDLIYKNIENIKNSENIFYINEYEMLDATFNKLSKYAKKVFDAREEKVKESAFYFCDLFIKRDKLNAFKEYHRLLKAGEPKESISGAMIYKLKMSRLQNKQDLIYIFMSIIANDHEGLINGEDEIEKLILSL